MQEKRTYRDFWMKENSQKELCELTEISITKRAARTELEKFNKRDVPMNSVKKLTYSRKK